MRARCFRCQETFETDHFGTQTCPKCGAEVYLPDPGAEPPAPGAGVEPPAPIPPAGTGGPGWGAPPQGWTPPAGPPPGWGPVPPGAVPPPAEQSAPFAERARRGFLRSYVETWKLSAVEPARFFRQVRISETGSAVFFGALALTLGNWAALVFTYLTANATVNFVGQITRRMDGRVDTLPLTQLIQGLTLRSFIGQVIATPLLAVIGVYLTAAVFHLVLLVVRGAPRGFDATLTVVGYASGIFLVRALPVCGGLIATVWFAVAAIQGLGEAQRSGSGKAAVAVLLPVVLAFLCLCGILGMIGIAGVGGLHGAETPPSTGL
jgi:hypothetical protein